MSICDRCIHNEVCGLEGNHEEAIAFCSEIIDSNDILKIISDNCRNRFGCACCMYLNTHTKRCRLGGVPCEWGLDE